MENFTFHSQPMFLKQYPDIYRDFFACCDIVVSAPGIFLWCGDIASRFGGLGIAQKVPFRAYVGLESRQDADLVINPIVTLARETSQEEPNFTDKQTDLIRHLVDDAFPELKDRGFTIHILSECPPHAGLGVTAATASAAATALAVASGRLTAESIALWGHKTITELAASKESQFNEIFRLAWKIRAVFEQHVGSGLAVFSSLLSSATPIVYLSEPPVATQEEGYLKTTEHITELKVIEQIKWQAWRLHEFFNPKEYRLLWPIDFFILYTGNGPDVNNILIYLGEKQKFLKDIIPVHLTPEARDVAAINELGKKILGECYADPWQAYIFTFNVISLRILKDLWFTLTRQSANAINFLSRSLRHYHEAMAILSLHTKTTQRIIDAFTKLLQKRLPEAEVTFKLNGPGRGGALIGVSRKQIIRPFVNQIVAALRKQVHPDIYLDYASWRDGIEEEGVIIEQHIEKRRMSPIIHDCRWRFTVLRQDGAMLKSVVNSPERAAVQVDLFVDIMHEKILINGEPVSSKELPSQKMAVKLLATILLHPLHEIRNKELKESSYTNYRNELQSKVVGPLRHVVKARTGKALNLSITGALTNFAISLTPSLLTVGVLDFLPHHEKK